MTDPDLDACIVRLNLLGTAEGAKRFLRVMRYQKCIAFVFEEGAAIRFSEQHHDLVKQVARLHGGGPVILDLTGCGNASSTALGYWANVITQVKSNGGTVTIVSPGEFVLRSLRMVGLVRLCVMADGLEQALQRINGAG